MQSNKSSCSSWKVCWIQGSLSQCHCETSKIICKMERLYVYLVTVTNGLRHSQSSQGTYWYAYWLMNSSITRQLPVPWCPLLYTHTPPPQPQSFFFLPWMIWTQLSQRKEWLALEFWAKSRCTDQWKPHNSNCMGMD